MQGIVRKQNTIKARLATVILCASFVLSGIILCMSGKREYPEYITFETKAVDSVQSPSALTPPAAETENDRYAWLTDYDPDVEGTPIQFDEFTNAIFEDEISASQLNMHFFLRYPHDAGIEKVHALLLPYTLEETENEEKKASLIAKRLKTFNPDRLDTEQKLIYGILKDYTQTMELYEGFELYDEPLQPTVGIQAQLPMLLAEYEFYSEEDVKDYLEILSYIGPYYDDILEFEKKKSEAGLFMSDTAADAVIDSCGTYLQTPDNNFLIESFNDRLDKLKLTEENKVVYLSENSNLINNNFTDAYEKLIDGITQLKGTGKNDGGISNFPNGKKYYEYLVRNMTGTSYKSMDELKNAIEKQIESDLFIIGTLNIDAESMSTYRFTSNDPTTVIDFLGKSSISDFPEIPEYELQVKYVPESLETTLSPAFYLVPCLDDYKKNTVYINSGQSAFSPLYSTLAHETIPGHMLQTVYFYSLHPRPIRCLFANTAYDEGWATYAENMSYKYDSGLSADEAEYLSRLSTASLGLYAYLDMYVNYYGASRTEVGEYLKKYYNIDETEVVDELFDVTVENPGNYLMYYEGYLEFTEMRSQAEEKLGNKFDAKKFHTFLLEIGPVPFSIIRPEFERWLKKQS